MGNLNLKPVTNQIGEEETELKPITEKKKIVPIKPVETGDYNTICIVTNLFNKKNDTISKEDLDDVVKKCSYRETQPLIIQEENLQKDIVEGFKMNSKNSFWVYICCIIMMFLMAYYVYKLNKI